MTTLSELLRTSGLSPSDYAYALGISKRNLLHWVRNGNPPQDVLGRAVQIEADIAFVKSLLEANPQVAKISYKIFKYLLDDGVSYSVD